MAKERNQEKEHRFRTLLRGIFRKEHPLERHLDLVKEFYDHLKQLERSIRDFEMTFIDKLIQLYNDHFDYRQDYDYRNRQNTTENDSIRESLVLESTKAPASKFKSQLHMTGSVIGGGAVPLNDPHGRLITNQWFNTNGELRTSIMMSSRSDIHSPTTLNTLSDQKLKGPQ